MSSLMVTVLGVLRRDDSYLVQHLTDPAGEDFYRPIGGGVEFRETSGEALEREFREELGVDVVAGAPLGTVENLFSWDGDPDHEIILLRAAEFADPALYDRERFDGVDAGGAVEYEATWETLADLAAAPEPLYPEGLPDLLRGEPGGHLVARDE